MIIQTKPSIMKKVRLFLSAMLMLTAASVLAQPTVYFTREITPESLVKIYKALGVEATGRVAVKISTGESIGKQSMNMALTASLPLT